MLQRQSEFRPATQKVQQQSLQPQNNLPKQPQRQQSQAIIRTVPLQYFVLDDESQKGNRTLQLHFIPSKQHINRPPVTSALGEETMHNMLGLLGILQTKQTIDVAYQQI